MDKQTKEFIQEHLRDDVILLGLQAKRYPDMDMNIVIRQIAGRQKIKNKIPLFYKQDDILFPRQLSVEQSSSEITAKYKAKLFNGYTFADLTGGFGVDFYFISQNFKSGIYVERDEELCRLANHNFEVLNISHFDIHQAKAEDFIVNMPDVDLIYIDPHRRNHSGKKTVLISDCEPDVSLLAERMLQKSPVVMIKLSPMLDIHQAIKELPQTTEVHIVAVENECKEILLLLSKRKDNMEVSEKHKGNVLIKTRNILRSSNYQALDFTLEEENHTEPAYIDDDPCQYIYEPNAAIMKSGAFKTVASRFKLKKFHVNSHLYTDGVLKSDFPGRIFQVKDVYGNSKADFRMLKEKYPKANISTRNYPLSVDDFRKKTGIKEGGDIYLFALKTYSEKYAIIVCNKVI